MQEKSLAGLVGWYYIDFESSSCTTCTSKKVPPSGLRFTTADNGSPALWLNKFITSGEASAANPQLCRCGQARPLRRYQWHVGEWSLCSRSCGGLGQPTSPSRETRVAGDGLAPGVNSDPPKSCRVLQTVGESPGFIGLTGWQRWPYHFGSPATPLMFSMVFASIRFTLCCGRNP